MDSSNTAAVEAKQELTLQLADLLTPHIYNGIKSIFDTCKSEEKVLRSFQNKLCTVPIWNQDIIDREFDRIVAKKDLEYLDKLIDMLWVSRVKVLSSLKLSNSNNKIDLQVPNQKDFVHKCYTECARAFWVNPFLMDDRELNYEYTEIQRNVKLSYTLINNSIEKTARDLFPLKDILEKWSQVLDEPDAAVDQLEDDINEHLSDASEISDIGSNSGHIQTGGGEGTDRPEDHALGGGNDSESEGHDQGYDDPEKDIDNAFMSPPVINTDSTSGNFNGGGTSGNFNGGGTGNFGGNDNTFNRMEGVDLTVSSGNDISETPPIGNYQGSGNYQSGGNFQGGGNFPFPVKPLEVENKNYSAGVSTTPDGIKNIMIQKNGEYANRTTDDDPFF